MHKKIDIFLLSRSKYFNTKRKFWRYECSTNANKTCKEAKHNFCIRHGLDKTQVTAHYSK